MIIKGRSPHMRHVSRTHRVSLDSNILSIVCSQSFDRLTSGSFTRDKWDELMFLFGVVPVHQMAKRSRKPSVH